MKDIRKLFRDAISRLKERGHKTLYVAVDAHGTIIRPSKKTVMQMADGDDKPSEVVCRCGCTPEFEFYPYARIALASMADAGVRLILWTSTLDSYGLLQRLRREGIGITDFNDNPDFRLTPYADFSKKFYFDVLLDDKAGFDPMHDWEKIFEIDFDKELKQEGSANERERER